MDNLLIVDFFFLIVYIGENYKFPDCDIYIFVPKSELLHLSNDPHTPDFGVIYVRQSYLQHSYLNRCGKY